MRLSVIGDELSQDPELVASTADQLRFDGVEVRSAYGKPPHQLDDGETRRIRAVLDRFSVAVSGLAPPVFKCAVPRTGDERAAARRLLVRSLEQARMLGAPQVRIFSFYRSGEPDPAGAAAAAKAVLDGVDVTAPLVVETGTRTNTPSAPHLLRFLDLLDRAEVGVLWDPGNSAFSGVRPDPYPADYDLLADRIRHVHVKDPDGRRGYVRLGDGDLDWPAILHRLHDDGFPGYVSLETHWRSGRQLSQQERDEPWGEPFSAGGYSASVECMQRLAAWAAPWRRREGPA